MAGTETNNIHSISLNSNIIHEDDLSDEAKQQFPYHSDIFHSFESYQRAVISNPSVTDFGRNFFLSEIYNLHTFCKRVLNYATEHNKFIDQKLPSVGPIILCGLPRTGTTLLYNLLACDLDCRAPLYTDMLIEVIPPIARSDTIEQKRRIDILHSSKSTDEQLFDLFVRIAASHAHFAIEEDYHISRQAGFLPLFTLLSNDPNNSIENWLHNEMSKDYMYDYLKLFLRTLNSVDMPKSHWLLKSHVHIFFLHIIFHHFPNALLVMTHRHLNDVFPSFYSLALVIAELYFDKKDPTVRDKIIKQSFEFMNTAIKCIMKFRTSENGIHYQSKKNILDINYDNLMKDPISIVHKIYDYFNLCCSNEMEMNMRKWLDENPQGKQGRHKYSLDGCGLNREDIETRYADYINLFLNEK